MRIGPAGYSSADGAHPQGAHEDALGPPGDQHRRGRAAGERDVARELGPAGRDDEREAGGRLSGRRCRVDHGQCGRAGARDLRGAPAPAVADAQLARGARGLPAGLRATRARWPRASRPSPDRCAERAASHCHDAVPGIEQLRAKPRTRGAGLEHRSPGDLQAVAGGPTSAHRARGRARTRAPTRSPCRARAGAATDRCPPRRASDRRTR